MISQSEWDKLKHKEMYGMIARLLQDVQELKNKVYWLEQDYEYHKRLNGHGI